MEPLEILDLVFYILSVTGGAAWLAAIPQVQKFVEVLPIVSKGLNVFAANVGGAKNKED
jgi:hypothetical protein